MLSNTIMVLVSMCSLTRFRRRACTCKYDVKSSMCKSCAPEGWTHSDVKDSTDCGTLKQLTTMVTCNGAKGRFSTTVRNDNDNDDGADLCFTCDKTAPSHTHTHTHTHRKSYSCTTPAQLLHNSCNGTTLLQIIWVATHKARISFELILMSNLFPGLCCPWCMWCLPCGYGARLGQICQHMC